MSDPTRPTPHPTKPGAPAPGSVASSASGNLRDRLGELARQRAPRPLAIRVLYVVIAVFAVAYLAGVVAGWWGSPVADKVRERRERDAREQARPAAPAAPAAPSMSDETPVPPR